MQEEQTKNSLLTTQFVFKVAASVLLSWSFISFKSFYKENPVIDHVSNALNLFLTFSIIFSIGRYIIIALYRRRHANRVVRGNFVLGINRLTAVLNTTVAIIAIMIGLGINPKDFITSMTIVAMAIAVTFREYITNMISGLFIMFSDSLSVGDRVKIGEHKGRIIDITFSSLIIQDEEEDVVMVPNNLVYTTPMVNLSAHRSTFFAVKFELPLDAAVEIDLLEQRIRATVINHPRLTGEDDLSLKVVEIGKDFVSYKMELHANSSSNRLHRQLENEILREVLKFKRERDQGAL